MVVAVADGLHARPAALFARLAADQPCAVTIGRPPGRPVPAAQILGVLTLGVQAGDEVVLAVPDDAGAAGVAALDALEGYLTKIDPTTP